MGRMGLMGLMGLMAVGSARAQSIGTARILEQAGQTDRAMAEYRLLLDKTPRDMAAYQGFARTCRQLARFDSLKAVSSRLSIAAPEEPQYVLGRMDGLLGLKRRKEALELGRSMVARWPRQAAAAADVLERWQELSEATSYLLAARKSQGDARAYAERLITLYELQDRYVELVDTGGMGVEDVDNLTAHIEEQIEIAIDSAAVILFVVDTRTGPTPLDEEVSKRIRYVNVPVVCLANKTDAVELDSQADDFYRFGRKVIKVSAAQDRGREELLGEIYERLPAPTPGGCS